MAEAAFNRILLKLSGEALMGDLDYGTDLLEIWRAWATDVRGAAIDCGHHVAEEKPDELARLVRDFLGEAFQ